ncbi:hypothetical protein [Edaphovirga cremea]|jgi:hypothetical protein|uniref:hypothetical protein n=1 Tax=Edaphovirga cremea TaxID=2267246 RepID=UPI003989D241
MISPLKFNELEKRVTALELALVAISRKDVMPEGMAPLTTMAQEMGISTKKAEELARNCGVMIVRHAGSYAVHEGKFREAATIIIRGAKRKYGSKYWYHPLIGKFTMSARPQL